jgi:hypothetical protein
LVRPEWSGFDRGYKKSLNSRRAEWPCTETKLQLVCQHFSESKFEVAGAVHFFWSAAAFVSVLGDRRLQTTLLKPNRKQTFRSQ